MRFPGAIRRAGEAGVGQEILAPHGPAQPPERFIATRHHGHVAVLARVDPRGTGGGIAVAGLGAILAGEPGVHPRPVHGAEQRLALSHLEELSLSRPVPVVQSGQDAQRRETRTEIIPDVDAHLQRRAARESRDGGETTYRLGQGVVRGSLDERSPLAEAGIGHVDQARVDLAELAVTDAPLPLQRSRAKVLDQDIALGRQLLDQLLAFGPMHVYRHVILAVVLGKEGGGDILPVEALGRNDPHHVPGSRHLHPNHLGPQLPQVVGGGRAEDDEGHVQDPDAAQRLRLLEDARPIKEAAGPVKIGFSHGEGSPQGAGGLGLSLCCWSCWWIH